MFVDYRTGSADLVPLLTKAGIKVEVASLEYADVEFVGRGAKGEPVSIGVEVKRLSELTGDYDRFAGEQLPKMQEPHYDHRWLIHEGEWRRDRFGWLQKRGKGGRAVSMRGQANASALQKKLLTLELCGGFHAERAYDRAETVSFLVDLYHFWTDQDLDQHKSHIVIYRPQGLLQLSPEAEAMSAWPGIQGKRARAVEKTFKGSIRLAASASAEEWAEITTLDDDEKPRKLGMKLATKVLDFLNGRQWSKR